jgi:hypothetical protein
MEERSRPHDTDPWGFGGRPAEAPAARAGERGPSREPAGGYAHPAGGHLPGQRDADPRGPDDRPDDSQSDPLRDPGARAYGRHGGDSTGYAGVSEHRYGNVDRRTGQRRRRDDIGVGAGGDYDRGREPWRSEGERGASSPGGRAQRHDPYRAGRGRDDDYRSSGEWQGPPGSGAEHESGYGQQLTHARGGYGEGSGFTDAGHGRGYATGYRPEAFDPRPQGDAGTRWSREQTHGIRERDDETARREGWPRERDERGRDAERMRNRGPRAYKRSDERIKEDIYERLIAAWEIDSSDVTVEVREGKVTLQGSVPERRMKHRVEDLVDLCHGVQDIDNFIRVRRAGEPWWAAAPAARVGEAAPATPGAEHASGGDRLAAPGQPSRDAAGAVAPEPARTTGDRGLGRSGADAPDGSAAGLATGRS